MNNNDYKEALFDAASIFNERLGTEFSEDNLVLCCFQTENQQESFEQFCKQYFPDRLTDRYKEDGYFDFHASAFVGKGDGVDGILLRTDIARHPAVLKHILLHELAHIFCTRNELGGDNFYKRYCMDDTLSSEEDGAINDGYAVWRELIAELIASEKDDNCAFLSLEDKEDILRYYMKELEDGDRKLAVSMLLCEALTSREGEPSPTWGDTKKRFEKYAPFDEPLFIDLLELVVRKLKKNFVEIDRDFILELGSLYLFLVTQSDVKKLQKVLSEEH